MRQQNIKLIFLFLAIFNLQTIYSQSELVDEEFVEYSEELALQDYTKALRLEQAGSLKEALSFYKYVAQFDSTNDIGRISKSKLDSIGTIEKEIFQNQFMGEWKWIWSGTNWGTENSPKKCNCQKYWKVGFNEILVLEDNQVIDKLHYKIEKDINAIGTGYFIININSGKKKWRLRIYREVENAYFLMERSKDAKFFLSFRDEGLIPNCVCGCPEKRFEKR
ncbi:MAG: hypothetical protein DWQ02_09605 [Bacteroidetes bacterium]|nr:MAG: hypothetical protein DWQ02_09605 [Bacteroidota bacterium]